MEVDPRQASGQGAEGRSPARPRGSRREPPGAQKENPGSSECGNEPGIGPLRGNHQLDGSKGHSISHSLRLAPDGLIAGGRGGGGLEAGEKRPKAWPLKARPLKARPQTP